MRLPDRSTFNRRRGNHEVYRIHVAHRKHAQFGPAREKVVPRAINCEILQHWTLIHASPADPDVDVPQPAPDVQRIEHGVDDTFFRLGQHDGRTMCDSHGRRALAPQRNYERDAPIGELLADENPDADPQHIAVSDLDHTAACRIQKLDPRDPHSAGAVIDLLLRVEPLTGGGPATKDCFLPHCARLELRGNRQFQIRREYTEVDDVLAAVVPSNARGCQPRLSGQRHYPLHLVVNRPGWTERPRHDAG